MTLFITLNIGAKIASVWSSVWPYLLAIFLFGMIIGIHEFGHFFFAKLFKVKVNEFALGMGPTILKKKKGDTTYALRLFPIGGFVSMEGEDENSEDQNSINNKPAWQRFIIVAAGAVLNLLLGVLVVGICLAGEGIVGSRTIRNFTGDAVSCNYGLKEKDEIIKINGTHVYSFQGISFNLMRDTDNKVDFTVIRDGKKIQLNDVELAQFEFEGKKYVQQDFIIQGYNPTFLNVCKNAFLDSASIVQMVRLSLVDLCTGHYGIKDMSGPIGTVTAIADTTSQAEDFGTKLLTALTLLSYLTINVGVFNLLPVPALDGGRLFFIVIEMIRRKPIDPKKEGKIHIIGLVLLLALMAVISVSDIIKLF